jgi:hypothetical protein
LGAGGVTGLVRKGDRCAAVKTRIVEHMFVDSASGLVFRTSSGCSFPH